MIDLKAQLYWARVERWIAAALLLEVSILLNTQRDSANSLYSGAPYPTQSLKNLHRRKGGGYFGLCIKIYRALGTLYAKRTFNRIAAKDYFKLNLANAADIPNSVKLHHIAV